MKPAKRINIILPDDLSKALWERAEASGRSNKAEVVAVLRAALLEKKGER